MFPFFINIWAPRTGYFRFRFNCCLSLTDSVIDWQKWTWFVCFVLFNTRFVCVS